MDPKDSTSTETSGLHLPSAVRHSGWRVPIPLVWVIPAVAAVIGLTIAVKAVLERGPVIRIDFRSGDGIEPGRTKIRYRAVDVGVVRTVELAEDHNGVRVSAAMQKSAAALLLSDSRFWVVRPRIDVGGVSGLGTLLSGSYIGMDVGHSEKRSRSFRGMEAPPVIESDVPGENYVLHGASLGSIEVGSSVYYRRLAVGRVTRYVLDPDGEGVTVGIFIASPFDQLVTSDSRFWHASGVEVALEGSGVRVSTESVAAILAGGIAFEAPADSHEHNHAIPGTTFRLAANRDQAMKTPDLTGHRFVLYFAGSLRGLRVGAPVDLNGVEIGEVTSIDIEFDPRREVYRYPVQILVYQQRIRSRYRAGSARPDVDRQGVYPFVEKLIEPGLRAQLRSGSLLTSSQYVALAFFPHASATHSDPTQDPMELPTVGGGLDDLEQSLSEIAARINALPIEDIGSAARRSLASLHAALDATTTLVQRANADIAPELAGALVDARRTLTDADGAVAVGAPLRSELTGALSELTRAAHSLRELTDYLERHPEAVLRGKPRDPRQ